MREGSRRPVAGSESRIARERVAEGSVTGGLESPVRRRRVSGCRSRGTRECYEKEEGKEGLLAVAVLSKSSRLDRLAASCSHRRRRRRQCLPARTHAAGPGFRFALARGSSSATTTGNAAASWLSSPRLPRPTRWPLARRRPTDAAVDDLLARPAGSLASLAAARQQPSRHPRPRCTQLCG